MNTSEYALIVDGKDGKAVTTDVVPLLQEALAIYSETPFKKRYMVQLASAIVNSQVKRVGEGALNDFEWVTSEEEALESFKKL